MDPVDAHVSEKQEGDHAEEEARPTWEQRGDVSAAAGRRLNCMEAD